MQSDVNERHVSVREDLDQSDRPSADQLNAKYWRWRVRISRLFEILDETARLANVRIRLYLVIAVFKAGRVS
jgi:hypothetical protein